MGGLSGDITTQYVLRYTPDVDPDEKPKQYRRIKVEVSLPDVVVRARDGYYPNALPGAGN